jgi:hypothetical protein
MGFNPRFLNRPRKKATPETHLVRNIIIYLRACGWEAAKIKTHGVYDKESKAYRLDRYAWTGVPDILAFKAGDILFIEAKVLPNKIEDDSAQAHFRALCKQANIPHLEINSLEQLQAVIK